ncbi:MAG: hypothetical protein M3O09_17765 [Acidobacteriota bacterium]|nr:hypothetical protein [Acidobacteriota bacterium]
MKEVRDQFRKISALLAAQADVSAGNGHSSTTGAIRESLIHKFLRPHLPRDLDVRAGVIIDSLGGRSRQQDCIIVDGRLPLIDVGSDTAALVLAESVVATIEVRSNLTKDELVDSLESCAITKRLVRKGEMEYRKGPALIKTPKPMPILTYMFSYSGLTIQTAAEHVRAFAVEKKDGAGVPEAICVLTRGILLRSPLMPTVEGQNVTLPSASGEIKLSKHLYTKDALFTFYRRLVADVMPLRISNFDIEPYYSHNELE